MIDTEGSGLAFLLGLPRSGTTLLSVMLDRHPAITSPAEPWIMLALHQIGRASLRHPANSQVMGTALDKALAGDVGRTVVRAAAKAFYDAGLASAGKALFVDKTPRYHLILEFLAETFPKAKFVWLLRDPFDVAASYRTTWAIDLPQLIATGADSPDTIDLLVGLDRLERFAAARGDAVMVVRYEDLVADPAAGLRRVLAHLDQQLPEDGIAGLVAFGRPDRSADQYGDPKILSTSKPHARSVGTWRQVFDRAAKEVLLTALGEAALVRLGYGATVAALHAEGVAGGSPALARAALTRAEGLLQARLDDMARETTLGAALPANVQQRVHDALAGTGPAPLSERLDGLERKLDEALAILAGQRAAAETARDAVLASLATAPAVPPAASGTG